MYHSHSESYIQDTTCPKGITFWLSHLSASKDCVQRQASVSLLWDTLHMGWASKKSCLGFAKCLRFLNMMMTFVLTLLSHYNSITKPRAWFLLSLLEDLSIDFPIHFIISIIDVYRDTTTCNKLIFISAIMRALCYFSIPTPDFPFFIAMGAISTASVQQSEAQLWLKRP